MYEDFFQTLWNASEGKQWFRPSMKDGVWTEGQGVDQHRVAQTVATAADKTDYYFTPLKYDGPRKRGMVGKPGVIFADIDDPEARSFRLPPSIVVSSSPGHAHAYWLLDEPVEAADWEPRAKGWTKEIGADPGGWDITQVLRIPGTRNFKYDPPCDVWIHNLNPSVRYPLDVFPEATVSNGSVSLAPVPDKERGSRILQDGISEEHIPLSSIYWLTATAEDIKALGKISRSHVMWQQERVLLEAGYTPEAVFQLLYFAGVNKWYGQPDKLWAEVNKAAGYQNGPS